MQCFLVRHATALPAEESPERPLAPEGRRETEKVARCLAEARAVPGEARILCSNKPRARQTAEILAEALGLDAPADDEQLAPNADPLPWAARILNADAPLVLVGHLPLLGRIAGYLLCGSRDREPIAFAPASVACLAHGHAGARLLWHLAPALCRGPGT